MQFSKNFDISKKINKNPKSITDASIWVKPISKISNKLEIEHSLLKSPIIIPRYGFHFRSTDLADKPHS